ncbi:cysteine proteinase [Lentinus tigrinus ALCF2SS1-7]|nr:cysteine proteinase [Lentinus tigrinus ALCF2SS1-7]
MASLSYLQPQLGKIHAHAEVLDVPTPVIDSLRDLLNMLNTPSSSSRAIRPVDIISALSNHNYGKHNSLFSSREHQDAQELFQLLSECIKSEAVAVAKEMQRDRGLGGLTQKEDRASRDMSKTVFDGLTANRRSCVECGYTEAVMHFPFDNWQLALPRMAAGCTLEDCLNDYTRLELLNDCICRKCSMLATYQRLQHEADRLTEASQAVNDPTSSKKKRARDSKKLLARVKAALDEGRIEEDIRGVKLEKVLSKASTKQSMIARPPPVLALHLNRSMHYGHYAAKNNCRVVFPEILDLTPYTTSGQLSTQPSAPISSPPPPIPIQRSITPTPSTYAVPRTLYRLSAVVCHYGQHSFGHYICFRRKPRPPAAGEHRYAPPRLACPLGCDCQRCQHYGPIRDDEWPDSARPGSGRGWLRISDDSVQEVGIERVLQEGSGAFMLYYERVQQPRSLYVTPPRGSEETVRPDGTRASTTDVREQTPSAARIPNDDAREREQKERRAERERSVDPRVVRRVSAGRSSSAKKTSTSNVAAPPPMSRSTSGSSAVTAVSTFSQSSQASQSSQKTLNGDASVPNGHAHSHHSHYSNGHADPGSPQRPPLPPSSPSKSGRLRKTRRSVSHADGNPVSPTQSNSPATSLRA